MKPFPLNGVIAIIANNAAEMDQTLDRKLSCVEIRADLLLDGGHSVTDVMGLTRKAVTKGLGCLFTLRHPGHGGKFYGSEEDRIQINQAALEAGASIIDLEWGSGAAAAMIKKRAPIMISHHDFEGMTGALELKELTAKMEGCSPDAIKVVPSASSIAQSVQMLKWVGEATDEILRIGFAMGMKGTCSRLLTTAYGAPITYASFGEPVAPGQISMEDLLNRYRVPELNKETRLYAIAGKYVNNSSVLETMNRQLQMRQLNAVCIPLETSDYEELLSLLDDLRIDGVHLEDPLKDEIVEKFPSSKNASSSSVFLEVSRTQKKPEIRFLPYSGDSFLQQIES